jgi:DNA-binding transcriptional ArsR family regulator
LNCILINGEVPIISDLERWIDLKERTIRKALKSLEEKGLIKLESVGVRKAIFFNPMYYSSGIKIEKRTLEMFCLSEEVFK